MTKFKCPKCGEKINPASMMAKESLKTRDVSSERMREIANKRWSKLKDNK